MDWGPPLPISTTFYNFLVRVLIWHGWLLEGSGSNVFAAEVTAALRHSGHDVLLLCQAAGDSAPAFVDEVGSVGAEGVSALRPNDRADSDPSGGRAVLLRPDIGSLLPVFVIDEYEGFVVKRFPDLAPQELDGYLGRNVAALRSAASWHRPDIVIASHVVPGGVVAMVSKPPFPKDLPEGDFRRLQQTVQEVLRRIVATQEEMDPLYEQMLLEMQQDDFRGLMLPLTAWGEKAT